VKRCVSLLLLLAVSLVACEKEPATSSRRPDPITIYAATADGTAWEPVIRAFTEDTGTLTTLKTGDPDLIVKAVIADNGSPPADVLLVTDVARAWLAAEEGGLRAIRSELIDSALAPRLRDPDDLWFAIGLRRATIVYDTRVLDLADIGDYANLSDATLRGKLCLSSSSLPVNRGLIAMLIADIGVRPAEIVVRGWKRNLAQLVFESEAELLDAIDSGKCGAGIASSSATDAFAASRPSHSLGVTLPAVAHINVDAVGVARHAHNPEGARTFVEWLVQRAALPPAALEGISTNNIGIAGWHDEDAVKLAERASYP